MLVCAMHPHTTIARAPCFAPEGVKKLTDKAVFNCDRMRDIEMITSLPGYDEQLFTRLKRLSIAMEAGTSISVRMLSQKIQFSSAAGFEIGNIVRSLGMQEETARSLSKWRITCTPTPSLLKWGEIP